MDCKFACFGSTAFALGSLFCMFKDSTPFINFFKTLDNDQQMLFLEVKKERFNIWIKSTALGILVSFLVFYYLNKKNNMANTCMIVFTYFLTQYLVYSLHPKQNWMLNHLKSTEQNKAWLEMYTYMKNRWHTGIMLGLVSYSLFTYYVQVNRFGQ